MTPIERLVRKQKVGQDDADKIAMLVMVYLDAAKRSSCDAAGANFLTKHLIIASFIAARTKSKRFHDQVTVAYAALKKASDRPTRLLDLTTGEHKLIAAAIKTYLCAMPTVEVGVYSDACEVAEQAMKE